MASSLHVIDQFNFLSNIHIKTELSNWGTSGTFEEGSLLWILTAVAELSSALEHTVLLYQIRDYLEYSKLIYWNPMRTCKR